MAEKQETITDIIAEKRRRAEAIEFDCAEKMKRGEMVSDCYARELVADIRQEADRLEAALRREKATAEKSSVVDIKFELCNYPEQVLKIGRDFQNKDGFRGAHYDTVKLLCDTIENLSEQTKVKIGDCAKMREALEATLELFWDIHNANRSPQSNQAYAVIRQIKAALAATEKAGGNDEQK